MEGFGANTGGPSGHRAIFAFDGLRVATVASNCKERRKAGSVALVIAAIIDGRLAKDQLPTASEYCPMIMGLETEIRASTTPAKPWTSNYSDDAADASPLLGTWSIFSVRGLSKDQCLQQFAP